MEENNQKVEDLNVEKQEPSFSEKLEDLKKKHARKIKREENKEEHDKKDELIKTISHSLEELQNKYLVQQADFQNYKRRREEETSNLLKYKNLDIVNDLLPVIDNFERSLSMTNNMTDEMKKYLDGYSIIYNGLKNILMKYEVSEIDCLNKEFDHNTCQALMMEHRDGVEPGVVIEVMQKGYMLKDRLVRPALVKVSE